MAKNKGIDKIKKKILADADAKVKRIKAATTKEVTKISAQHKKERERYKERYEEQTAALVQSYKQKSLAQARLDAKKRNLREREKLIDAFVTEVITMRDARGYERFLKKIIKENLAELGRVTISCAKRDVAIVEKLAPKVDVRVTDIDGGLIFEDASGKRVDESLQALLSRRRDEIRQEVARFMK